MKILKSNLARVEKQIRGRESEREREWKWNLYLTHIWWLITFILCMRKMECVFSLKEENVLGGSSKSVSSSFIRNRSMKIYFEMSDYIFKFKGMSRGFLLGSGFRSSFLMAGSNFIHRRRTTSVSIQHGRYSILLFGIELRKFIQHFH